MWRVEHTAGVDQPSNDERLLTAGATGYAFDHNGNQTQVGARTFVWDLANRLISTTLSGTTTSYTYTGDGRRVSASTGAGAGNTTSYLWDVAHEVPQVALERDGAGTLLRRYTYGLDRLALSTPSASFARAHVRLPRCAHRNSPGPGFGFAASLRS